METTTVAPAEEKGSPGGAVRLIRKVRKYTRKNYLAEDKIRIVLEGFRKEMSIADLCRRESIHATIYYKWLKDFMEGGKARLTGDTLRNAGADEVKEKDHQLEQYKIALAEKTLENQILKKTVTG